MTRGRPVSFDKSATLEKTLKVFWRSGYLGTTYTDLCAATGLTKPSLYCAYGNKEATFLAALDMYLERFVRPAIITLEQQSNPRDGVYNLLLMTAEGLAASNTPLGCLIASNITDVEAPAFPRAITQALHAAMKETPNALLKYLSAVPDDKLPSNHCAHSLAIYFEALIAGLSSLARNGTSKQELASIVHTAMAIWQVPCEKS